MWELDSEAGTPDGYDIVTAEIVVPQKTIEQVVDSIIFRLIVKLNEGNQTFEWKQQIRLAWTAFGKLTYDILRK